MEIQQRIEAFNTENAPFYIVGLENGVYSLCLPLDLLGDKYSPYCQEAFDAYAVEIGEPASSPNGLKTHGSGYEWEAAFREAFTDDPHISEILFDCEMGGFFCDSSDLSLLRASADASKPFARILTDSFQLCRKASKMQKYGRPNRNSL